MPLSMRTLASHWSPLTADKRAVTALEYSMIAATIVTIGLAGFGVVGNEVATKFTAVKNAMDPAAATTTTTTTSPPPTHRYED